jgi:hypothetical protein
MDRMAKQTQDPDTLKELFAALDNDPYLIAECLARPILGGDIIRYQMDGTPFPPRRDAREPGNTTLRYGPERRWLFGEAEGITGGCGAKMNMAISIPEAATNPFQILGSGLLQDPAAPASGMSILPFGPKG